MNKQNSATGINSNGVYHRSLALCWLYTSSICSLRLFKLCQMAAQWTPKHLKTWPCGTASRGCGNSHRKCADQYDQPPALGECAASAAASRLRSDKDRSAQSIESHASWSTRNLLAHQQQATADAFFKNKTGTSSHGMSCSHAKRSADQNVIYDMLFSFLPFECQNKITTATSKRGSYTLYYFYIYIIYIYIYIFIYVYMSSMYSQFPIVLC